MSRVHPPQTLFDYLNKCYPPIDENLSSQGKIEQQPMAEMIPFQYVEFYDVPRCLTLRYKGKLLLLQSAFDEETDDYPSSYSVYLLPEAAESSLTKSSWDFLESTPMTPIGNIPVDTVNFDPTKRHSLDPACLNDLPI